MGGRTVTLVGFMGSGKSTVGRILSRRLKWPFRDTDALAEDLEGRSIARIFAERGEAYFREVERRVVLSTPAEGERVMALGGGALDEVTLPFLNGLGPTVHLDLTFQEAVRRIGGDPRRPLASGPDLFGLFLRRKRWYARALHRVWTEGLSVDEVVESILRLL